jgi:RNA polymerase sigma-70 factor (ECF subfamily)
LALRDGNLEGLRGLLAADVQMIGDSGGKAPQRGAWVVVSEANQARRPKD